MKWDYEEMLEASQKKEDKRYETARMYVETHNKDGALRNVAKWYDYCTIKGIHPFEQDKPMPENTVELNALEFQQREEELAARRKYGKGGIVDEKIRNDRRISNEWSFEKRKRWLDMSDEDRLDAERKLKGNQRVEDRAMLKVGVDEYREAFRKSLDFRALRNEVKKAELKKFPSQKHRPARLRMVARVKKNWGILSQRLYETSLPILDMEKQNEADLHKLTDAILNKQPVQEQTPARQKEERQEDRRSYVDLSNEDIDRKDKDRFGR